MVKGGDSRCKKPATQNRPPYSSSCDIFCCQNLNAFWEAPLAYFWLLNQVSNYASYKVVHMKEGHNLSLSWKTIVTPFKGSTTQMNTPLTPQVNCWPANFLSKRYVLEFRVKRQVNFLRTSSKFSAKMS